MCGMELNEHGFFEELRRDHNSCVWETHMPTSETTDFHYCNDDAYYNFDVDEYPNAALPLHPSSSINSLGQQTFPAPILDQEDFFPYPFSAVDIADSAIDTTPPLPPLPEDWQVLMMEEGVMGFEAAAAAASATCKVEQTQSTATCGGGMFCLDRKKLRGKRVEGQPSKNLMAERRRRKRLNDRLSMLRSVVPKISKMDRTSILGDTIDYMKELLERIGNLQEDEVDLDKSKGIKSDEILMRNSPKFNAERRDTDTRIEVACPARPGLLLSTVKTLEALGLEIEQCVISCFNDFAMQASCSEELEQRRVVTCEDIKQALFRIAGYGGRCL